MVQPTRELSESERLDWLRLARTESVGPITFRGLIGRFGTARAALEALPEMARRGGRKRGLTPASAAEAEREVAVLATLGGRMVALCEPDYPEPLAAIEDAPPVLSVLGRRDLMSRRSVAVVGARNASGNGRRIATKLARDLGAAGLTVVSGLARGIDAAAHEGALESGTVAVVAGGIDVVYPRENDALYRRIAEDGVVVAECAFGIQPQARHFPRRNRIISGLSVATIVVEAAPRSGSLITARMANEQGREVFAVPGSPLDPRAQGCNALIRKGATLIQSADDVLEALSPMLRTLDSERRDGVESLDIAGEAAEINGVAAQSRVLECLSPTPTPVDEVLRDCQLSAPTVFAILLELELAGRIERHPGNRVMLI